MAAGQRAGRGGSTRTWGETLYSQPLGVSAPYKLVGLAFQFAEVWAGGHQRCFCAWTPPSPSLSGGPAQQEEGRWVGAGQCQPSPHRAGLPPLRSFSRCPAKPRCWLASQGSARCWVRQEARPPPPVSWGDRQSWGACWPCLLARLLHLGRVGLRPLPRGSQPSQLRRWLSVSPPST